MWIALKFTNVLLYLLVISGLEEFQNQTPWHVNELKLLKEFFHDEWQNNMKNDKTCLNFQRTKAVLLELFRINSFGFCLWIELQ
jgi:hypothetical protein